MNGWKDMPDDVYTNSFKKLLPITSVLPENVFPVTNFYLLGKGNKRRKSCTDPVMNGIFWDVDDVGLLHTAFDFDFWERRKLTRCFEFILLSGHIYQSSIRTQKQRFHAFSFYLSYNLREPVPTECCASHTKINSSKIWTQIVAQVGFSQ